MSNKQRDVPDIKKKKTKSLFTKKIGTKFQPYNIKSHISLLLCTYKCSCFSCKTAYHTVR